MSKFADRPFLHTQIIPHTEVQEGTVCLIDLYSEVQITQLCKPLHMSRISIKNE